MTDVGGAVGWVAAGWWRRVLASVLDAVLLLAAVGLLATVTDTDARGRSLLSVLAAVLYTVPLVGGRGRTVGCLVAGTRVVADDGRPSVGTGVALLRWLAQTVLGLTVVGGVLDALWPLWDARSQTLHDKLAATYVVRTT